MQIFDYSAMGPNLVPATEGTPGAGQVLNANIATINVANFVDYVSYSNKVKLTNISDTVAEGTALIAYRGALSIDVVTSTLVDVAANSTALDRIDVSDGTYMAASLSRKAYWQLRNFNVKPKANGMMFGIIPSLAAFDLVNDATAAGLTDLQKFSEGLAKNNQALAGIRENHVGVVGGVDWFESNALLFGTNWQSSAHNAYSCYVFGKEAVISSSLGKTELGQKNFYVKVANFPMGTNSIDPAGLIAAASIYNVWYGAVVAPQHNSSDKFRRIRVESSIG
jgi:N4-gp56 family major capsid protein